MSRVRRRDGYRSLTFLWVATCTAALWLAASYVMTASVAWRLGMRAAALYGVALAGALVVPLGWLVWQERRDRRTAMAKAVGDRLLGGPTPLQSSAEMVRTHTSWDWLHSKLFPDQFYPSKPGDTRTFLRTRIDCTLSGADRLRLLLTGSLCVRITTYTDVEVKQAESLSTIEVHPFKAKE